MGVVVEQCVDRWDMDEWWMESPHEKLLLGVNSRGRPEPCLQSDQRMSTDNWKMVTGRTWLQLMCCTHLYNMQVGPIISEWSLETGVGQKLNRGWTEIGGRLENREIVRGKRVCVIEHK